MLLNRSSAAARKAAARLLLLLALALALLERPADAVPAAYDEDGDLELYAWRTTGQGRSQRPMGNATLTVHLVPHAHLDVGWLKTVDECWYGANQSIQDAAVGDILEAVFGSLALDSARKWTMGEQAFFQRWWHERGCTDGAVPAVDEPAPCGLVRRFVASKQLVFVDGGWSQHDTGCTHYTTMLDQTTFGQSFLERQFGVAPRVGWHLDPFGHTSTQVGGSMGRWARTWHARA